MSDAAFMSEAVALARQALDDKEGGPFGAVVVRDGRIVGRGRNQVIALADPTAHAEVMAVRDACAALGVHDLSGCTVYSSSEPCPMCLGALFWARVDRIVFGVDRDGAAAAGFDDALFYEEVCRERSERRIRTEFQPSDEARRVMEAWRRQDDRVEY